MTTPVHELLTTGLGIEELSKMSEGEFTLELLDRILADYREYAGSPAHFRAIVEQLASFNGLGVISALQINMMIASAHQCVLAAAKKELPTGNG